MVDIRKDLNGALVVDQEPDQFRKYAMNAFAGLLSAVGMMSLIAFTSPNTDQVPTTAQLLSSPLTLSAVEDLSAMPSVNETVIRSGMLTQTVSALDVMEVLGADRTQADDALTSLRDHGYIPRSGLQAGISITVHLNDDETGIDGRSLAALTMRPEAGRSVIAKRMSDGSYFSTELTSKLTLSHRRIAGTLTKSLSEDLGNSGANASQVSQFLSVFAYSTAVPTRLSLGDQFEMVYEVWEDERGQKVEDGNLVYASLDGEALSRSFYRYTPRDNGHTDFFDADGDSAERFLARKPVPGAAVSSSFGRRVHPIDGVTHIHKGVDFRAPMSARIYAAGDGIVEKIGRGGGYGRQVVIRHANGYKTKYAHMSGYSRQLEVGKRVRQGDLVGFVGSTGHATGPHLHYEVTLNGRHVDPMSLQLPTGRKLKANPAILAEFDQHRKAIDAVRRELGAGTRYADAGGVSTMMRAMQAEAP